MYEKYLFVRAGIHNLSFYYLLDEEVAFKNAALLYAKKFYQISYQIKQNDIIVWQHYFNTLFKQKPFSSHLMPLVENLFLDTNFGGDSWNRYYFTFIFNKEFFEDPKILDLEIDKRFVRKLLRNVISLKMN